MGREHHFPFGFMNSCFYFFRYIFIIDTIEYDKINGILDGSLTSIICERKNNFATEESRRLISEICFQF